MGSLSLLAASVVVALLGFGWINAIKEGVFDFFSFLRPDPVEEVIEDKGDVLDGKENEAAPGGDDEPISVDPEFDEELNQLDDELDALLKEADAEFESLEGEL